MKNPKCFSYEINPYIHLHNIGSFDNGNIDFMSPEKLEELKSNPNALPPVVIITGENGAGKSVILDAIRAWTSRDREFSLMV